MTDDGILHTIEELVEREHRLRERRADGSLDEQTEHEELAALEVALDQCWDLLRQRRAKRDYGAEADEAAVRPPSTVEGYLQ